MNPSVTVLRETCLVLVTVKSMPEPKVNGSTLTWLAVGCLLTALVPATDGWAQSESGEAVPENAAASSDGSIFLEEVSAYSISYDEAAKPLSLEPRAVLNWSNPISNDQVGAIFLWKSGKRPEVIGCCFQQADGGRIQEFHSLSTKPLRAQRDGKEVWHPRETLEFQPVPGVTSPAGTAQARLLQMRRISRRFTAQMTRDGNETDLRLISRPVVHYQPKTERCTDGAIFSFAAGGTDPDAFLLIENRLIEGEPTWVYAFARFHFAELRAQLNGAQVWAAKAKPRLASNYLGSKTYRDDAYIVFRTY